MSSETVAVVLSDAYPHASWLGRPRSESFRFEYDEKSRSLHNTFPKRSFFQRVFKKRSDKVALFVNAFNQVVQDYFSEDDHFEYAEMGECKMQVSHPQKEEGIDHHRIKDDFIFFTYDPDSGIADSYEAQGNLRKTPEQISSFITTMDFLAKDWIGTGKNMDYVRIGKYQMCIQRAQHENACLILPITYSKEQSKLLVDAIEDQHSTRYSPLEVRN